MATVKEVEEAFTVFVSNILDRNFRNTKPFHRLTERKQLLLLRFFLLGRFGDVKAEYECKNLLSNTCVGKIDFVVNDTAIEVAVRTPERPRQNLKFSGNKTEVVKLLSYQGKSILVLIDLSDDPMSVDDLADYRDHHHLIHQNNRTSSFNVLYYSKQLDAPHKLNVRA